MKTDPNVRPAGRHHVSGSGEGKNNFNKDKPKNDKFFKKPNQNGNRGGGDRGPPERQWKSPDDGRFGNKRGGGQFGKTRGGGQFGNNRGGGQFGNNRGGGQFGNNRGGGQFGNNRGGGQFGNNRGGGQFSNRGGGRFANNRGGGQFGNNRRGGPPGRQWKPRDSDRNEDNHGGDGPPGKQWQQRGDGGSLDRQSKPPGGGYKNETRDGASQNDGNRSGDSSGLSRRPWKPRGGEDGQHGGRKPYERNQPKGQGQRQRGGANLSKPRGEPNNTQQQQKESSHDLDALFTTKPEKLNYCLAPERLEAQERALKRFDKQDREAEHQQKQNEKQRKHKMMTAKTKKGQPVMQGRMELLYEKVQKIVGQG